MITSIIINPTSGYPQDILINTNQSENYNLIQKFQRLFFKKDRHHWITIWIINPKFCLKYSTFNEVMFYKAHFLNRKY